MDTSTLRLLAWKNNPRGDLFTRLTGDLFFALGYDDLRLDVNKIGRELDVQGKHRLEPRRVIAECKAHKKKMGGAELNKFIGVLTIEKDESRTPVTGYFVSLNGFTGPAIELAKDRIVLLDAARIIEVLEHSSVLVGYAEATERAGHCAAHAGLKDAELDGAELLGHERGYLWAVFYAQGKERTHFGLIHADGTPLAEAVAQEVIDADRKCDGSLHTLHYLAPPSPAPDHVALAEAADAQYRKWLAEECGYIQLDGLPADTDLSTARLKLERLFVPLKVIISQRAAKREDADPSLSEARSPGSSSESTPQSIGEVLSTVDHLSLLAAPGGGKSTLLKRLAIAYAFPEQRADVDDELPERDWLPLYLRCRELRDRAHRPILELLDDLTRYSGMSNDEASTFRESAHEALRAGRALVLVDGLDEISEEGARRTFAQHLRTFLAMFPQAALVVTSREAGFRQVAGVVASACTPARLAPFDKDDVERLCVRWNVEVVGDNDKVRSDARELAGTIWDNERIRTLAENPLLLTTLLVVKRWIGELPRGRAPLYRAAISVLIRTWNVEGFAPLDEEETLTQLSYVACVMMEQGTQQIGQKALHRLLQNARQELDAELQFASISATAFIERVEYRSSLLMQTGHGLIDGELQPVYEFRHLTFQEYLAARGYVEEQYPGRDAGRSLADLLEPHFEEETWREVVPLAAVLAGRKAAEIIRRLTGACEGLSLKDGYPRETVNESRVVLLRQCLLDEVQVPAPPLRAALRQMARHGSEEHEPGSVVKLRRGKFGTLFQEVAEQSALGGDDWREYMVAVGDLATWQVFTGRPPVLSEAVADLLAEAMSSGSRLQQIRAALVTAEVAYRVPPSRTEHLVGTFITLRDALRPMLDTDDPPSTFAACHALVWIGHRRLCGSSREPEIIRMLFRKWRAAPSEWSADYASWALANQPLLPRDTFTEEDWGASDNWLRAQVREGTQRGAGAAIVVGWYRYAHWVGAELAAQIQRGSRGGVELWSTTAAEIYRRTLITGSRALTATVIPADAIAYLREAMDSRGYTKQGAPPPDKRRGGFIGGVLMPVHRMMRGRDARIAEPRGGGKRGGSR